MSATSEISRRIPGTAVALRTRHALAGAGVSVAVFLLCWYLAFHDVTVARADAHAYFAFLGLSQNHAGLRSIANWVANLCDSTPYVYLAGIPVVIALLRRRWALAGVIAVMIPGAVVTTELLKHVLNGPRPAIGVVATPLSSQGSFPSGHSTAAMVLALALVLASSSRWRPYVAVVGTTFALGVIYSVLSLGWHYPSDALGGILVALTWTMLGVAAVVYVDRRFGRDLQHLTIERTHWLSHMPSVGALLGAACIPAVAVLMWRGGDVFRYAALHSSFVAAFLGVALFAVAAPAILAVVLNAPRRRQR